MSSSVYNTVLVIAERKIYALTAFIKGKLKYLHTGITRLGQKLPDAVCKESQILCDHIQILNFLLQNLEQFYSRTFFPLSVLSGLISIGN